jgi:hypothetical protein
MMRAILAFIILLPLAAIIPAYPQTTLQPGKSITIPATPAVSIPAVPAQTITCAAPVPAPAPAPLTTYTVYSNGMFEWAAVGSIATPAGSDWNANATANYRDSAGAPLSGTFDIAITITGAWGEWQPHPVWVGNVVTFDTTPYKYLVMWLKPTKANQKWSIYSMLPGDKPIASAVSVNAYGPAPVVGTWSKYTIPLAALMTQNGVLLTTMYKFSLQDQTGLATNVYYVDNVIFTQ